MTKSAPTHFACFLTLATAAAYVAATDGEYGDYWPHTATDEQASKLSRRYSRQLLRLTATDEGR